MKVYLDNAATTNIAPEVVDEMVPVMKDQFGNPSSTHAFGRQVRGKVEVARRSIAKHLNVTPGEIVFTSGGTEADNMAIRCSVEDLGVKRIITTSIEHHAVLHTVEDICKKHSIEMALLKVKPDGHIDVDHLDELLQDSTPTLVSLMHANNEIGNLIPLEEVGKRCREAGVYFHSDTVQTMGHYSFDLSALPVDFITCSAHKFHGPKGIGFLYISKRLKIKNPLIHGGSQERNRRGGTENVYGIVGLSKALDLALTDVDEHQAYVKGLKEYMIEQLEKQFSGVQFNGDAKGESLYTVLNVSFPKHEKGGMLLFHLDLMGIAVSGGSACSSGSNVVSHVLAGIHADPDRPSVRFSFSRYNTKEEIDYTIEQLKTILG